MFVDGCCQRKEYNRKDHETKVSKTVECLHKILVRFPKFSSEPWLCAKHQGRLSQ